MSGPLPFSPLPGIPKMCTKIFKVLILIAVALLPVTIISPRCYADHSDYPTDFIPADGNAQSQGILGYLTFIDPEDNTRSVLVVASSLFSSIEQNSGSGCASVFSATSNVNGEQLTLSIDLAGTASFIQDDVVVSTLASDHQGGFTYTGSTAQVNRSGDSILYRSGMNAKIKRNFQVFSACDFITAITQHIPDKRFQMVRYYGWYSNKMRGQRSRLTSLRKSRAWARRNSPTLV